MRVVKLLIVLAISFLWAHGVYGLEILPQGIFEGTYTGIAPGWDEYDTAMRMDVWRETTGLRPGTPGTSAQGARTITETGATVNVAAYVNLTPGKTYRLEYWYKVVSASPGTTYAGDRVTNWAGHTMMADYIRDGAWHKAYVEFIAQSVSYFIAPIEIQTGTVEVIVDDLSLWGVLPANYWSGEPTADTSGRNNYPDTNYGTSQTIDINSINEVVYWRGLLKWNLPTNLAGARIVNANIDLKIRYHDVTGGANYPLYRLTQDWTETGMTWNTYNGINEWPGGKYSGKFDTHGGVYDIQYVPYYAYPGHDNGVGEVVFDATELVQDWADGDINCGVLIDQNLTQNINGGLDVFSKERGAGLAPKINITYFPSSPYTTSANVHVDAITASELVLGGQWAAKFEVKVVDKDRFAVSGANVKAHWTGIHNATGDVQTDVNGIATFTTAYVPNSNFGTSEVSVDLVTATAQYHKYNNVKSSASICGGQLPQRNAKFIKFYAHDDPTANYLVKHLAEIESMGLDGLSILPTLNNGNPADGLFFKPGVILTINDFSDMTSDLQKVPFNKLTDNSLLITFQKSVRPPIWSDTAGWNTVVENMKVAATIVQQGGLKGICLDLEMYSGNTIGFPFEWDQVTYPNFSDNYNAVYNRAYNMAVAMNTIAPGLYIFVASGTYITDLYRIDNHSLLVGYDVSPTGGYQALLPAFIDGLLAGVGSTSLVISSLGEGVGYRYQPQYDHMKQLHQRATNEYAGVSGALLAKHKAAQEVQIEDHMWPYLAARFDRLYTPAEFQHALYAASLASDSYVVVYNEKLHFFKSYEWWGNKISVDYINALRNAGSSGGITDPPLITLFSDGFESGNFTVGGWTNSGAGISTTRCNGSYSAILDRTDYISKAINTTGYGEITFSYKRKLNSFEAADHFYGEWAASPAFWYNLEDLGDGRDDGLCYTVSMPLVPDVADNNPDFKIRFRMSAGLFDYAYIDDVKVEGFAMGQ